MVRNLSSGVNFMNYDYELKYIKTNTRDNTKNLVIYESENGIPMRGHGVNFVIMKRNSKDFHDAQLERMYKWLETAHPELIL
jgi:hypothetical protein